MKRYKIFLNGENFKYRYENDLRNFGFYTSRTLDAESPEDAVKMAIESVWSDSSLAEAPPKNDSSDRPRIWAQEITELQSSGQPEEQIGLVFYLMDQQ
jgi:hypothetical protein